MKRALLGVATKLSGRYILKTLPHGNYLNDDLKARIPEYAPRTVFDVGAHVGESAREFTRWFPCAQIVCFEPAPDSFAWLTTTADQLGNVSCHRLALGEEAGEVAMAINGSDTKNHIIPTGVTTLTYPAEQVQMTTLMEFCAEQGIDRIALLKVDTEGHDMAVLKGAESLLDYGQIDLIQLEAGMNPENHTHVPFETLKAFLEGKGYRLFGLYEQIREWPTKQPHLRRVNPVFMSNALIQMR